MWHDREFRLAYLECLENIAFVEWCIATVEMKQVLLKYSANQPRAPRGQSNGGQWVAAGGGSGGRSGGGLVEKKPPRRQKPNEGAPITPTDKPSEEEEFPVVDLISDAVNLVPLVRRLRGVGSALRVTDERLARIKLNKNQAKNLTRFEKKLPVNAKKTKVGKLPNGHRIFQADVPARNIPGSYARYEKVVNKDGKTVKYTKTTYGPDGKIIHIKEK